MQRHRFLVILLSASACVTLLGGVRGQSTEPTDLTTLMSGTRTPLSLTLKELDQTWRRVTLDGAAHWPNFGGSDTNVITAGDTSEEYYTKGQVVTTPGGGAYLIAYRIASKRLDLYALVHAAQLGIPKPPSLTPDTRLTLCLLDLRTAGSLNDIQPFDSARMMAQSQGAAQAATALDSDSNLKQIGLGLIQYVQDYDEKLPPMQSVAAAKKAIYPYVRSDALFIQPETQKPYQPNTSLSHRSLASFPAPADMVAFFEAGPAPDGTRGVLFLDGHVKRFPEAQWPALRRASHVPGKR